MTMYALLLMGNVQASPSDDVGVESSDDTRGFYAFSRKFGISERDDGEPVAGGIKVQWALDDRSIIGSPSGQGEVGIVIPAPV